LRLSQLDPTGPCKKIPRTTLPKQIGTAHQGSFHANSNWPVLTLDRIDQVQLAERFSGTPLVLRSSWTRLHRELTLEFVDLVLDLPLRQSGRLID
jgi:hypothetical protein